MASAPRRRKPHTQESDNSQGDVSDPNTPDDAVAADATDSSDPPHEKKKYRILSKKPKKRSLGLTFAIGGVVGLLLAGLAKNQDMVNLDMIQDLRLDALVDVIPAGILKEATIISQQEKQALRNTSDPFFTGLTLRAEGLEAKHPVIMIPGVISTGLESWGTEERSRGYFRKRLWGSWTMLRAMVTDRAGWMEHIMLDKYTGLDPPGIKLRAAQGFDATDFFITGYWIWSKIIENLAGIGYDPSTAYTASYDWRLAYGNLEVRDQYFSRLKQYIETAKKLSGKKVVLTSHSMGSQVVLYFFKWVEAEGYGHGGKSWVDDHIEAFINISGCMLGAVKGLPAVLSGEMKDTATLSPVAVYGLEKFFSREDRAQIMRAMMGISSMLPKGGDAVWGNHTWAPDDVKDQHTSFGSFLKFPITNITVPKNLTTEESLEYLLDNSDSWYRNQVLEHYSHGVAHTTAEVEANDDVPSKWLNPLEVRLPYAPNMKIFCFYGVGKPTERSYYFRPVNDPSSPLNLIIDTSINEEGADHGVVIGEGDGTVPLLSAGYMCTKGWKMKRYNPALIPVTTFELPHEPDRFDMRGGPNTGDHVDILGRPKLNELILRVAAGRGSDIEENIESNILKYAEKVKITDD